MGTWSVSLYGNDASADVRGDVRELLRTPLDNDEIVAALIDAYPGLNDPGDEEHCDLWLAVADQLHAYNVAVPAVLATATRIIDTGLDLDTKRSLGMVESDLSKRARMLSALRAKWAQPHPRPFKRRVQSTPDAFVFDVGDCVAYPVSTSGDPINPYYAKAEDEPHWKPAGFGAMGVLARGRRFRTLAWYAVARLSLQTADKPSLAQCAAAMIETESSILEVRIGEKPRLAVYGSRLTPQFARKMGCEIVGHLEPDEGAIQRDFGIFFSPTFVPGVCLANELTTCIGSRGPSSLPLEEYLSAPG